MSHDIKINSECMYSKCIPFIFNIKKYLFFVQKIRIYQNLKIKFFNSFGCKSQISSKGQINNRLSSKLQNNIRRALKSSITI